MSVLIKALVLWLPVSSCKSPDGRSSRPCVAVSTGFAGSGEKSVKRGSVLYLGGTAEMRRKQDAR